MAKLDIENIKKLKELTGAGVLNIKNALEEFDGDFEKAKEKLVEEGKKKAATKTDRVANDGLVYAYIHNNGRAGSLIHMACETDFVAKTEDFQKLCKEVALQVVSMDYDNIEELLNDEYIRDSSKKISDLITDTIAKLGENIELRAFKKMSV
jgi:elongation factor Ts